MTWLLWLGLVLCLLTVAVVGLSVYGAKRWTDTTWALTSRLKAARIGEEAQSPSPARYELRDIEGLPAPVQRYFRAVLKEGQPIIAVVTLELAGTFNLSAAGEQWKPFTSRQRVVTRRPGFLWDAQVSMLPGVSVREKCFHNKIFHSLDALEDDIVFALLALENTPAVIESITGWPWIIDVFRTYALMRATKSVIGGNVCGWPDSLDDEKTDPPADRQMHLANVHGISDE